MAEQSPRQEKSYGPTGKNTQESHPAFATIGASRGTYSGEGTCLFGSDFHHRHSVTITINRAVMDRTLSKDWPSEREQLIQVELSEAQWAGFVSSLNMGTGVPCTLRRHPAGGEIPAIAPPESRANQFKGEMSDHVREAEQLVAKLREVVAQGKMSASARKALDGLLEQLTNALSPNLHFVSDQFERHVHTTLEKAKTEANAYLISLVVHHGLSVLTGRENTSAVLKGVDPKKELENE